MSRHPYRLSPSLRQTLITGAKWGGLTCGLLGFATGITICIVYRLPVPPIAVTEMGALSGAILGAALAWAWTVRLWRETLRGGGWGFLAGLPLCVLNPGGASLAMWVGCACLGTFLGYQKGSLPEQGTESWRLFR